MKKVGGGAIATPAPPPSSYPCGLWWYVLSGEVPDNNLYSSDCRIMENREDKKSVENIMNPSSKPLFSAVIGTIIGVVIGYYLPKVGMTVGGLSGFIVGSFIGVVVARSIDKIRYN